MDDDFYKIIPNTNDYYRAGKDGTIWSCHVHGRNNKIRGDWRKCNGKSRTKNYINVKIAIGDRKNKFVNIHKLVLLTFVGPYPEGMQARHLDGNSRNNSLTNLVWGTPQENTEDKFRHGTVLMGERHYNAQLTLEDVEYIKTSKETDKELAVRFNKTADHIYKIRTGERWNNGEDIKRRGRFKKVTDEAIEEIRKSPLTTIALAELYGLSQGHVSAIKLGNARIKQEREN